MNKRFIILFLIGLSFSTYSQEEIIENDSLLLWQSNRPLNWKDFKGEPKPLRIHNMAGTAPKIIFIFREGENGVMFPFPLCYFEKYRSWTSTENIRTLEHEQIHFDIEEIYTRKLRMKFEDLKTRFIYDSEIYNFYVDDIFNKCSETQNKYDVEVFNNIKKQEEWKIRITKELKELKEYEYIPEQ